MAQLRYPHGEATQEEIDDRLVAVMPFLGNKDPVADGWVQYWRVSMCLKSGGPTRYVYFPLDRQNEANKFQLDLTNNLSWQQAKEKWGEHMVPKSIVEADVRLEGTNEHMFNDLD